MGKKAVGMLVGYVLLAVIGIPVLVTAALGGFREEHMTEAKALYGLEEYWNAKEYSLDTELERYVAGVVSA